MGSRHRSVWVMPGPKATTIDCFRCGELAAEGVDLSCSFLFPFPQNVAPLSPRLPFAIATLSFQYCLLPQRQLSQDLSR